MRKLLTVRMTAALFHKHENTIYRWLREDRLFPNAFRIKDGYLIPHADITRLIRDGRARVADQRSV